MEEKEVRKLVRKGYSDVAKKVNSCCNYSPSCCGSSNTVESVSKRIGYTDEDLKVVPEGANLGLGCGNPIALASLEKGETVLDLGSGAGFDCFLAANQVGKQGRVIGIDMTPEMLEKAQVNKQKGNYDNVEFRLGEIESLPVADDFADVVISNCVINLSPDKEKVFKEIYRVLKPGGRLLVSDIVLLKPLPDIVKSSAAAYIGCIAGASLKHDYLQFIESSGFENIKIMGEEIFPIEYILSGTTAQMRINKIATMSEAAIDVTNSVISIKVLAVKKEGK